MQERPVWVVLPEQVEAVPTLVVWVAQVLPEVLPVLRMRADLRGTTQEPSKMEATQQVSCNQQEAPQVTVLPVVRAVPLLQPQLLQPLREQRLREVREVLEPLPTPEDLLHSTTPQDLLVEQQLRRMQRAR